jgi:hypothetical protein
MPTLVFVVYKTQYPLSRVISGGSGQENPVWQVGGAWNALSRMWHQTFVGHSTLEGCIVTDHRQNRPNLALARSTTSHRGLGKPDAATLADYTEAAVAANSERL